MNAAEGVDLALKIAGWAFDLAGKAWEAAKKGDAEALAEMEEEHRAWSEFRAERMERKRKWREENDGKLAGDKP